MIENVQSCGKYASLRAALNETVRRVIAFFGRYLATFKMIKS